MVTPSVVLHAGHQQIPFPVYLYRVFVILLLLAILAVGIYWCFDAVEKYSSTSATAQDAEEVDR